MQRIEANLASSCFNAKKVIYSKSPTLRPRPAPARPAQGVAEATHAQSVRNPWHKRSPTQREFPLYPCISKSYIQFAVKILRFSACHDFLTWGPRTSGRVSDRERRFLPRSMPSHSSSLRDGCNRNLSIAS